MRSEEVLGREAYDYLLTALTVLIVPFSFAAVLDSASGAAKALEEAKSKSSAFLNPMLGTDKVDVD